MASNAQTRGQMAVRYNRLVKLADTVKLSDSIAKFRVEAAKATLDMFPISTATSAGAVSTPV